MRCNVARRKLIERELGAGPPAADADLARHLKHCAGCAAEVQAGPRIVGELARLRTDAPFEFDVVGRVRAGLVAAPRSATAIPAIDRRAVLWIAAGLAAIFSTLAWGVGHVSALLAGLGETWTVAAVFGRVAFLMFSAVGRTLETAGALAFRWISIFASAVSGPIALGLSVRSVTLGAAVAMTLLTLLVLARDVRRSASFPTKGT